MKLLELHSPGTTVELHPRLAVVHASEAARRALVESLRSALQGGHRAAGFVEVHGIILDLDRETLALLDLDDAVEMVLVAADVPVEAMGLAGRPGAPSGEAPRQSEVVDERRQQVEAAAHRAATTQAALRVATEERHAVASRLGEAQQGLEEAVASREAAERAVDSATDAVDEIERDEIERDELERDVPGEIIEDPRELGAAEQLRWADPPALDTFEEHDDARRAADEARAQAALDAVVAAEAAVAEARDEVERAARAANPARLAPDDRADLEAAHEAVIQADDRAARRFGGAAARRKLDEAKAVERTVLDRLGFDSYSDFLLRSSMGPTDPSAELRLEIARSDLLRAEATLTEALVVAEATPAPPPRPAPALTPTSQPAATAPRVEPETETVSTESSRRRERAEEASVRLVAARRARDEASAAEAAAHAQVESAAAELADADAKLVELAVRHDEAEQLLAQARVRADGESQAASVQTDGASTGATADGVNGTGRGSVLDEVDRYLLAWLAARGQHPLADPLPLVLDDVYHPVSGADLDALLVRLDHLADSLHVVYLTDDQHILRWAAGLPPERGALSTITGAGSPTSE